MAPTILIGALHIAKLAFRIGIIMNSVQREIFMSYVLFYQNQFLTGKSVRRCGC